MLRHLAVIFALSVGCAFAQTRIPDTPAGQTLRAWFEAYNSGDRARVEAFIQKFAPALDVDGLIHFREATGSLELVSVDKAEPGRIKFHVRQTATSKTALGELTVTDATRAQIRTLDFMGLQPLQP